MDITTTSVLVGTLVLLLAAMIILWFLPKRQVKSLSSVPTSKKEESKLQLEKDRLKFEDEHRKTLAQIIGGALVLAGLAVTFFTYILSVQKQDLDREAQMTDRFSKAIEHLGSEKSPVRVGALFELERIARDSPKDEASIKEVFLSYLHENFAKKSVIEKLDSNGKEFPKNTNGLAINWYLAPLESQGIMRIFGRLKFSEGRHDFSYLNLAKISFAYGDYSRDNFAFSDLSGSNFFASDFSYAKMQNARLVGVRTDLLEHVEIDGAIVGMVWVDKVRVKFSNADLSASDFSGSDLSGAVFTGVLARETNFSKVILYQAVLSRGNFDKANFSGANLKRANLIEANLRRADMTNAEFGDTVFDNTNFESANLAEAKGISLDDLRRCVINVETKLPSGFEPYKAELIDLSNQKKSRLRLMKLTN